MPLPDGRPSLYDLNPSRYSNTRAAADKINKANDAVRASSSYRDRAASIRSALGVHPAAKAGLAGHHSDVPKAGGGGHGGNPNHDEHGRFA